MIGCTEPNCSAQTDLRCDGPACGEPFCADHLFVTERDGDLCTVDYNNIDHHVPEIEGEV